MPQRGVIHTMKRKSLQFTALAVVLLFILPGCSLFSPKPTQPTDTASPAIEDNRAISARPKTLHMKIGDEEYLQTTVTPEEAADAELVFSSSNDAVAYVRDDGTVTALGPGACTVTIALKDNAAITCQVAVFVAGGNSPAPSPEPGAQHVLPVEVTVPGGSEGAHPSAPTPSPGSDNPPAPSAQPPAPSGGSETGGPGTSITTEIPPKAVTETDATRIYPAYVLSQGEADAMSAEEAQFTINQIYAKNGYIFRNAGLQAYFAQMSWYRPVTQDSGGIRMSSVDRQNLRLLTQHRNALPARSASPLGQLWSYRVAGGPLEEAYVKNLSPYDVQLLINTIYAKNGFIFDADAIQKMFEGQSWYKGVTSDPAGLTFSQQDQQNLRLLAAHR